MEPVNRCLLVTTAAALLISMPAMAQTSPAAKSTVAEPAAAKPAAVRQVAARTPTKPAGPREPRSAKSLACSKEADGKTLHGAARTTFMRNCNKG